jgi:hypothetical protein
VKRSLVEIFESAIDDGHGQVDAGYLAIAVSLIVALSTTTLMTFTAAAVALVSADHHLDLVALGAGIKDVWSGFGLIVAAVGAFRWGDKDRAQKAAT